MADQEETSEELILPAQNEGVVMAHTDLDVDHAGQNNRGPHGTGDGAAPEKAEMMEAMLKSPQIDLTIDHVGQNNRGTDDTDFKKEPHKDREHPPKV